MKNNFKADVLEATYLLTYVISVHLHIERWMRDLLAKSSSNQRILNNSNIYFLDLVKFCHDQNFIDDDLVLVLKKVNTLRNKFAHIRSFVPKDEWVDEFLILLRNMKNPFFMSFVPGNEKELCLALASLSGYMEKLVIDN